jgi:hypothetical protein
MKKFFAMIVVLLFVTCKKDKATQNISQKTNNISIIRDTLKIKINNNFLPQYNITNYNKKLNSFFGYNHALHQIDYFNFNEKNIKAETIKLDSEGPDTIYKPNDIFVTNNEEIYLISYFNITKLNKEGNILEKRAINSTSDKDYYKNQFLFPNHDNGFEFNYINNKFYILNTNMKISKNKNAKEFYDSSKFLSTYNFDKDEIESLSIKYPEEFSENNHGFNDIPFISMNQDKILYSFSSTSPIYEYDIDTKKTTKHKLDIENLPEYRADYPDINSNSTVQNRINSFIFNSIFGPVFSNGNNIFRTYQSAIPESKKSEAKEYLRKSVLQVYDKKLNHLKDYKLNFRFGFNGIFSNNESVFFQLAPEKEDEISFLKLTIKK